MERLCLQVMIFIDLNIVKILTYSLFDPDLYQKLKILRSRNLLKFRFSFKMALAPLCSSSRKYNTRKVDYTKVCKKWVAKSQKKIDICRYCRYIGFFFCKISRYFAKKTPGFYTQNLKTLIWLLKAIMNKYCKNEY